MGAPFVLSDGCGMGRSVGKKRPIKAAHRIQCTANGSRLQPPVQTVDQDLIAANAANPVHNLRPAFAPRKVMAKSLTPDSAAV
jgi:hypothetical protein